MNRFDLRIDCLRLEINTASGCEHRVRPIALRATEVLAARLDRLCADAGRKTALSLDTVSVPPVNVDWNRMSDEQAANQIADAWLSAVALHMGV
jgi:hypothetical protein